MRHRHRRLRLPLAAVLLLHPLLVHGADEIDILPVSHAVAGAVVRHVVARGDSLAGISAAYGVDVKVVARENGLAPTAWLQVGQTLLVDHRHIVPPVAAPSMVVNVPQRLLFLLRPGEPPRMYPIAVGRPAWPTPLGAFTVLSMEERPIWDVPESIRREALGLGRPPLPAVVPPGPENPLGEFWIGLSHPGIGIHGTPAPLSVYRYATHGCIRVEARGMRDLFGRVRPGDQGRIIYAPVLLAEVEQLIFVEVHADPYGLAPANPRTQLMAVAREAGLADRVDWAAVDRAIAARDGIARIVGVAPFRPGPPSSS